MEKIRSPKPLTLEHDARHRSTFLKAAAEYAEHGWPVLPGSVWNGRRFVVPGQRQTTDGLRPVVPRNYATSDMRQVNAWWSVTTVPLVPSVLLRSGSAFDVLVLRRSWGERMMRHPRFHSTPSPLMWRPNGQTLLLVRSESELRPELQGRDDIELLAPGSWIPAPPTREHGANAQWWVDPEFVSWRLADLLVLHSALVSTRPETL